jgi:hypothetical protein
MLRGPARDGPRSTIHHVPVRSEPLSAFEPSEAPDALGHTYVREAYAPCPVQHYNVNRHLRGHKRSDRAQHIHNSEHDWSDDHRLPSSVLARFTVMRSCALYARIIVTSALSTRLTRTWHSSQRRSCTAGRRPRTRQSRRRCDRRTEGRIGRIRRVAGVASAGFFSGFGLAIGAPQRIRALRPGPRAPRRSLPMRCRRARWRMLYPGRVRSRASSFFRQIWRTTRSRVKDEAPSLRHY